MNVGSLFSGIGGFDLGLERAGFDIAWQVEIDPYCQRVLAKHWPHVPRYGDITAMDWATVQPVDLLCGGFPCQDLSFAGKRAGIDGERSGLWSEYVRAIVSLRPRYVLVENVPGLLTNQYMGRVLGDLALCGYDAEWDCIPASAVGAPHRRDRVWIVAYNNLLRCHGHHRVSSEEGRKTGNKPRHDLSAKSPMDRTADVADSDDTGLEGHGREHQLRSHCSQIKIGRSSWWESEPDVGRVAYGVPSRVDRLKGLGNAVVPQIVEALGRMILETEEVWR